MGGRTWDLREDRKLMTDDQVRQGFSEIYNEFWNRYKNHVPKKDSEEWDRLLTWASVLKRRYPFLKETVIALVVELDQRMRRKDEAKRDL